MDRTMIPSLAVINNPSSCTMAGFLRFSMHNKSPFGFLASFQTEDPKSFNSTTLFSLKVPFCNC